MSDRLGGLVTDPIFNIGLGLLGSQSPHLSGALADGGRQLQSSVLLKDRLQDNSVNRQLKKAQMEYYKNGRETNASTNAIRNAQFMFPNDPVKQREYIESQNQGNAPSPVQEWNVFSQMTPEQQEQYLQMKRANQITDIGGVKHVVTPIGNTKPLGTLEQEAAAKETLAAASKSGQLNAENTIAAKEELPRVEGKAQQALNLLDQIENHPGLSAVVGAPNPLKGGFGAFNIPGSQAADFRTYLDQLGGQIFLDAYQGLKGGGQITEVEGEQAKNAIARMQSAQSEQSFKNAINDYRAVINAGVQRARAAAGVNNNTQVTMPMPPQIGEEKDGYLYIGGDPSKETSWRKK